MVSAMVMVVMAIVVMITASVSAGTLDDPDRYYVGLDADIRQPTNGDRTVFYDINDHHVSVSQAQDCMPVYVEALQLNVPNLAAGTTFNPPGFRVKCLGTGQGMTNGQVVSYGLVVSRYGCEQEYFEGKMYPTIKPRPEDEENTNNNCDVFISDIQGAPIYGTSSSPTYVRSSSEDPYVCEWSGTYQNEVIELKATEVGTIHASCFVGECVDGNEDRKFNAEPKFDKSQPSCGCYIGPNFNIRKRAAQGYDSRLGWEAGVNWVRFRESYYRPCDRTIDGSITGYVEERCVEANSPDKFPVLRPYPVCKATNMKTSLETFSIELEAIADEGNTIQQSFDLEDFTDTLMMMGSMIKSVEQYKKEAEEAGQEYEATDNALTKDQVEDYQSLIIKLIRKGRAQARACRESADNPSSILVCSNVLSEGLVMKIQGLMEQMFSSDFQKARQQVGVKSFSAKRLAWITANFFMDFVDTTENRGILDNERTTALDWYVPGSYTITLRGLSNFNENSQELLSTSGKLQLARSTDNGFADTVYDLLDTHMVEFERETFSDVGLPDFVGAGATLGGSVLDIGVTKFSETRSGGIQKVDIADKNYFADGALVEYTITVNNAVEDSVYDCVYHDEATDEWNNAGCESVDMVYDKETQSAKVTCACNHTTSFAVLVTGADADTNGSCPPQDDALSVVTTVGLSLSIAGCALTLIVYAVLRLFEFGRIIQMQFCVAMIIMALIFLFGIEDTEFPTRCTAWGFLLQYFVLVCFSLMMLLNHSLRYVLYNLNEPSKKHKIITNALAWIIPLVFPLVAVIIHESSETTVYGQCLCFVTHEAVRWGTFNAWVLFAITFNVVHFVIIVHRLVVNHRKQKIGASKKNQRSDCEQLIIYMSLAVFVGLTWIFGFVALVGDDVGVAMEYAFALTNAFQGAFVFIVFVLNHTVLKKLKTAVSSLSSKSSSSSSQLSQTTSNQGRGGRGGGRRARAPKRPSQAVLRSSTLESIAVTDNNDDNDSSRVDTLYDDTVPEFENGVEMKEV